jgi:hypothetical protein
MMLTEVRERLEAGLRGNELRGLVAEWQREGKSQAEVHDVFEAFMLALRSEEREAEEDLVGDALDYISGWCRRDAMWFERALTSDELKDTGGCASNPADERFGPGKTYRPSHATIRPDGNALFSPGPRPIHD